METTYRIEPCKLDSYPPNIGDLIAELVSSSEKLGGNLHPQTAASLANLVRMMNCYYSNLIEGHNTKPMDIERALGNEFDAELSRRNLQIEAKAHIQVQKKIDELYAENKLPEPASICFLKRLHQEFYLDASEEMLTISNGDHSFKMQPGEFRTIPLHNVTVGRHCPPLSENVDEFMRYFESSYKFEQLGRSSQIVAMAAAHHRFAFVHPFPDGNGRVSRLMSHAMGLKAGVGSSGLWSISRGLARGLENRQEYKKMMDYADSPRQGDLDGRGNLSKRALTEFVEWFLKVCIDQTKFMSEMLDLNQLLKRLKEYVEYRQMKPETFYILEKVLLMGDIPRGDAARLTGLKERSARVVLVSLLEDGILESKTPKGAVSLHFSNRCADVLFPRLYGETTAGE